MEYEAVSGKQFIGGHWSSGGGQPHERSSAAYGKSTWTGEWADLDQASAAVSAALDAARGWSETALDDRISICRKFATLLKDAAESVARQLAIEMGKPLWEAKTEVAGAIAKVENSVAAILERRWTTTQQQDGFMAVTRYRPLGVMFVIGPFNLPLHLPGAHMVPALLAGNTIVFKPSELTPAIGQTLVALWEQAGVPEGVVNLIHGGADVARSVVDDQRVAGVLFTGSHRVGTLLHKQLAGQPHRMLALELGGNNPLVVHNCTDLDKAAQAVIMSSMITSGQRCTCARRLIVVGHDAFQGLLDRLASWLPKIKVGLPLEDDQPFMGPLIHQQAASDILATQEQLCDSGGQVVVACERDKRCAALLTPGLTRVDASQALADEEHFGPHLVAQQATDLDHAIQLANNTQYGLAAGFLGDSVEEFYYFLHRCRAGIVNWNRQTTGASGKLPFGGVGASGNHQPSGYFAADYCSYPMASLEATELVDLSASIKGLEAE